MPNPSFTGSELELPLGIDFFGKPGAFIAIIVDHMSRHIEQVRVLAVDRDGGQMCLLSPATFGQGFRGNFGVLSRQ